MLWLSAGTVPDAIPVAALGVAGVLAPDAAWARSGGYSRPSGSFSAPRTPSFSGGYSRPRTPAIGTPSRRTPDFGMPSSAGDRAMGRSASGEALGRYRQQQQGPTATAPTIPAPGGWGGTRTPSSDRGWSPPPYATGSAPRFGAFDAMLLWFLLDRLQAPGNAAFFHDHENDPGYREWRAEAEKRARDDPELRSKLARLDSELAARQGQPRNPDSPPPAMPDEDGGFSWVIPLLLGGMVVVLWRSRRRIDLPRPGGLARKGSAMDPLSTAANILRQKASGQPYKPTLFRVGMVVSVDPTPFLLATDTKVVPPVTDTDQTISIEAVGRMVSGTDVLHRLYLPDSKGFFQLHLDDGGQPDECRFFSVLDEIEPADEAEWGFWLDRNEGMVGWPEFQTKDGKIYPRVWAPGATRVPPREFQETADTVQGLIIRAVKAMLYGAPTGAAEPAPAAEYILVGVVEEGSHAWVQVAAGIDVNPASLSLT